MTQLDLRPLGIGEILDRAVTLYVRRFAVLVLILALVATPVAIAQYAATPSTTALLTQIQRAMSLPPGHQAEQRAILRELSSNGQVGTWGFVLIMIGAILGALSTTACVIAVAQAYAGKLPSVREAYREALLRWPAQLAAGIIFMVFGFVLMIALAFAVFVVALAVGALAGLSRVTAAVVGIPLAIVFGLLFCAAIVLLYFAAQMTLVSIALEDPNPIRGIAHGLRRTLSPAVLRRSLLVALIVFAVSLIGTFIVLTAAAGISAVTHLTALYPVFTVIGSVALNGLLTTFIVIYAFDVRVRREGFDLALAAQDSAFAKR